MHGGAGVDVKYRKIKPMYFRSDIVLSIKIMFGSGKRCRPNTIADSQN